MSLYDPENPQHLDYLARARAASRRATERLDTANSAEGMTEAKEAARLHWRNKAAAEAGR